MMSRPADLMAATNLLLEAAAGLGFAADVQDLTACVLLREVACGLCATADTQTPLADA